MNAKRLALSFAALAALIAASAAASDDHVPSITVTGTGRVSAAPDQAAISVGVVAEAVQAADAVKANTAAMQRVFAALDAAGIERKDVQTSRFDVSPIYADRDPQRRVPPPITGYRAANQVRVEVLGIDKVGVVLDALVAAGANDISGISFGIAEPDPLLDAARTKAIADARRKADLYARDAGVAVGRVLSIQEGGHGGPPVPVAYARMEAAAPPIASGQLDLSASVTVTWAIAP